MKGLVDLDEKGHSHWRVVLGQLSSLCNIRYSMSVMTCGFSKSDQSSSGRALGNLRVERMSSLFVFFPFLIPDVEEGPFKKNLYYIPWMGD